MMGKILAWSKAIANAIVVIWSGIGLQWRLHLLIQLSLLVFFLGTQNWIIKKFDEMGIKNIEMQASETADGLINGLNLLMITGQISNPSNRELLLKKMSSSYNVRELNLARADQVTSQFGPGLLNEAPKDDLVRQVLLSGKPAYAREVTEVQGGAVLRVVIPIIASENFRGTNCLSCHQVQAGSVNGAIDIRMDLSSHEKDVLNISQWLWSGMLLVQLAISALIALFVRVILQRHLLRPVLQMQSTIEKINQSGDFSLRIHIDENEKHPEIDKIAESFNSFIENLKKASEGMSLLAKVVENSQEAILITNAHSDIVFVNDAFVRITGYSEQDVLGKNPRILKSNLQDSHFYKNMWKQIMSKGSWQGEIFNKRKNGEIYPEWQSIFVVKNDVGGISNYVSIFLDISSRKAAEAQVHKMANFDPLTGLANRNLLHDRISQSHKKAHRQGSKFGLMYLDLDNFKDINDAHGHGVGDLLLKNVAERLLGCIREGDTVSRSGGDEFILLLLDIDGNEGAAKIAEKILLSIAAPYRISGLELFISASVGVAIYPDDSEIIEQLLKHSDMAMYHAKQKGKNCYSFFTSEMKMATSRRAGLQNSLRKVLQRNELEVYYQPQLNVKTGKVIGAEALLRWREPNLGYISPAEFIPIAEESGLILNIGKWVLTSACMEAKKWHDRGEMITISVNISGCQFKDLNFISHVREALETTGLESAYLELELTETVLISQSETLADVMTELKSLGVKLAIDDFGTGYSSLSYIKKFPIDRIKIDQSFIRNILIDKQDSAIVDAIIYIAHALSMEVIAEGVESIEQLKFMSLHGCNFIQGYFVSKPIQCGDFPLVVNSINNSSLVAEVGDR